MPYEQRLKALGLDFTH